MPIDERIPKDKLERVPARVFACLRPGELRLFLWPENEFRGPEVDVPIYLIPPSHRILNSQLWVRLDQSLRVLEAWPRD